MLCRVVRRHNDDVGRRGEDEGVHPTPYTLHPAPYTLHPKPYTLNLTPPTMKVWAWGKDSPHKLAVQGMKALKMEGLIYHKVPRS